MADDDVLINVRTTGAARAAADARKVGDAWATVGKTAAVAGRGLRNFNTGLISTATAGTVAARGAQITGAALLGTGALAAKTGLQFNAMKEQSQVAFTQLIGSAAGARQEFQWLQKTAAATPFELQDITKADRQLLAYNFTLEQTHSWLRTIADVGAGAGFDPGKISQLVTVIGQIRSKGRLQGDELMQLSELGILDRERLAKDLQVTPVQLASGNANIAAPKALRAIQNQFDDKFGGQSAKQSQTFNGQLSTLHDNLQMTLGSVTYPGFRYLEKTVFPALNEAAGDINKIFGRNDLDLAQKMSLSRQTLKAKLGPLEAEAEAAIGRMHIGQHIEQEFERAAPMLINAAAEAAPHAASAFLTAWWNAGVWGKLFTLGLLSKKLGVFSTIGSIAAERFAAKYLTGVAAAEAASAAGGAGGAKAAGKAGLLRKIGGIAAGAAGTTAGVAGAAISAAGLGSGLFGGPFGSEAGLTLEQERRALQGAGRPVVAGDPTGSKSRALADAVRRGNLTPAEAYGKSYNTRNTARHMQPITVHTDVSIDGKVVAQAVGKHVSDVAVRKHGVKG